MDEEQPTGLKIYFNPWVHTIEQNNAFLAAGYEVMPMQIPSVLIGPKGPQ